MFPLLLLTQPSAMHRPQHRRGYAAITRRDQVTLPLRLAVLAISNAPDGGHAVPLAPRRGTARVDRPRRCGWRWSGLRWHIVGCHVSRLGCDPLGWCGNSIRRGSRGFGRG